MIRSLLALLCISPAWAQEEPAPEAPSAETGEDDTLTSHRTRFDVLAERTIGTASKPVAFNWRRTTVQLAASGSFLFELNNFNNARVGGLVRLPGEKFIGEIGVSFAHSWDTRSSRLLALTPYRQPGRPSRLDLDINVAYPLAEGVVTAAPKFFPASQLVFNGYAGFRYSVYPTGWGGMRPGQVLRAILNPALTDIEIENLDEERLAAMAVDPGRYGFLVGFGNDLYFEQGFFLSPRLMVGVPILAPAAGSNLLFWADFTMTAGVAF